MHVTRDDVIITSPHRGDGDGPDACPQQRDPGPRQPDRGTEAQDTEHTQLQPQGGCTCVWGYGCLGICVSQVCASSIGACIRDVCVCDQLKVKGHVPSSRDVLRCS